MHLLYFHGSTVQAFVATGKVRFLEALNPGGLFETVHMVNYDTAATTDLQETVGSFRFTAIGLARAGTGRLAKLQTVRESWSSLARDTTPRLVLADDANLLGLSARRVASRFGAPYAVCIYYDNDLHHHLTGRPALGFLPSRGLEKLWERYVLRGSAGVYAQTRGYRDYGRRHGAPPARTYLGSWSVDDVFYAEPPPPHPDGRPLLYIGRLHALKFIGDLLEALARLPAMTLDIAGQGPERERLEAKAASLGLGDRVRFLGLVRREELIARMQAARVLLATQGVSAVVESVLSGRPVVAYDHECNGEFIRHEETGLLVPFRDVEALTAATQRVLADAGLARRLGERGRRAMLAECRISDSIEHRRQFFRQCLQA